MKFGSSLKGLKFGKKVKSIDLSAEHAPEDREPVVVYGAGMTKSSGSIISVRSTASSKKLCAILGPEALLDECESDSGSRLYTTQSAASTSSTRDESEITDDTESEVEDDESIFEDDGIMANFMLPDEFPATTPEEKTSPLPEHAMDKQIQELQATVPAPASPDVEALSVSQFPTAHTFEKTSSFQPSTHTLLEMPLRTSTPSSVDFEEVCERLRDSLSLPSEIPQGPKQDFEASKEESTTSPSSSQSSTRLFTEPPTPALSSSASSLSSVSGDEKMAKTKSSLVADHAALEAKFRLAAARDALKKVKSNVVAPSIPDPRLSIQQPRPSARRSLTTLNPPMVKSPSLSSIVSLKSSHSSISVNELNATNNLTSKPSRSSRARDNRPLTASKSNLKIGVAAPKNLNMMRSVSSGNLSSHLAPDSKRTVGFPSKSKGKASVYVPQNHITSIHEVLA